MIDKIKKQLAEDLAKIQAAVKNSNPDEMQAKVSQAITAAKDHIEEHLEALEQANTEADKFLTPFVDRVNQSKYTPLIISGIFIAALSLGVAVGIYL